MPKKTKRAKGKKSEKPKSRAAAAEAEKKTTALARPSVAVAKRLDDDVVGSFRAVQREEFRLIDLLEQVNGNKTYERLGYESFEDYVEQHVGTSYRAVRKRFLINQALRRLSERDRKDCFLELLKLGVVKSAIIAPVLGKTYGPWRDWTTKASEMGLDELGRAVDKVLKARRRPGETEPQPPPLSADARWLAYTLNVIHPDSRDEVEDLFSAARTAFETESNLTVFLALVRNAAAEVYGKARPRGWRPKAEIQETLEAAASRAATAATE